MSNLPSLSDDDIAALATLPQFKARLERILDKSLTEMEKILKNGDPPTKAMLLKQVVPQLVKALQPSEDNGNAELMREFRALRNEFRGIETPEVL